MVPSFVREIRIRILCDDVVFVEVLMFLNGNQADAIIGKLETYKYLLVEKKQVTDKET